MRGAEVPRGAPGDDVLVTPGLGVWRFVLNDLATNGFVVRESDTSALAIVDPGGRAEDLIAAAGSWGGDVRAILVTHLHGDHWAAIAAVRAAFPDALVVAPPGAPFAVDRPVSGGESIALGAHAIQVAATPGHSPESVSYQIGDHVFVGDLVFRLGSGRTDGARASTEALFDVVRGVLAPMPDATILWCGHGPPTTIGEERRGNPIWRVALEGEPGTPLGDVAYDGGRAAVLAWADDYDGGRKALLRRADGGLVVVPGSRVGT